MDRYARGALSAAPLLVGLLAAGCVWRTEHKVETVSTINAHIVLDIRQIRDEADRVEGYVRGADAATPSPARTPESAALAGAAAPGRGPWAPEWVGASAPSGAEPAVTDAERRAIEARRARFAEVNRALDAGYVGENDHGYLSLLPAAEGASTATLAALRRMVEQENADRRTIYQAVAQRSTRGGPEGLAAVEAVFAEKIRQELKPGQTFQVPLDPKLFDAFRSSDFGRPYADARPGDWIKKKPAS